MGDGADMALDQMCDPDEWGVDGFDNVTYDEEFGSFLSAGHPKPLFCKYCKKRCHWDKFKGKWRLFENGSLHICPVNPLKNRS